MNRKIYMAAGYNTISLGTGRKEFHPKKPRPLSCDIFARNRAPISISN